MARLPQSKSRRPRRRENRLRLRDRIIPFVLPTMGGGLLSSRELLSDGPVLFYFWASWREGSGAFLQTLERFIRSSSAAGLSVVAIALDVHGPHVAMPSVREAGATFPTLIDACALSCRVFGLRDVPALLLCDRSGAIRDFSDVIEETELHRMAGTLRAGSGEASEGSLASSAPFDPRLEILMQSCTNFLGRGRKEEATQCLRQASELLPAAPVIKEQLTRLEFVDPPRNL